MSSEAEEKSILSSIQSQVQTVQNTKKLPRLTYSREFLLSLKELHVCIKLPKGVDASILGEFQNVSSAASEQQIYFQNAKRNEHGYVQSNRVESSTNYSRGAQGRWETCSSGSSDREELQVDRESEFGKCYVNPSRRSWQQTEYDGLLGKPSGYSGQASAQRIRGNNTYQLNKSTEPYQPPRLYKPAPYARSNTDSLNDETFGLSECSSLDRAEEEKRRASFHLMRRKQQKTVQEKQNYIPDDQKNLHSEIATSLDSLDGAQAVGNIIKSSKLEENLFPQVLQHCDSSGSSLQLQAPAARPLVPPGFGSNTVEKKLLPPLNGPHSVEVEKSVTNKESSTKHANGVENIFGKDSNGKDGLASQSFETFDIPSISLSYDIHRLPGASECWKDDLINDSNDQKMSNIKQTKVADEGHSTSILDKLFQNALTRPDGGIMDFIEHRDPKEDETKTPTLSLSSKFAHFFLEDQQKPVAEDLLSLGISNDEVGPVASIGAVENITKIVSSDLHIKNEENYQDLLSTEKSTKAIKQEPIFLSSKSAKSSDLLTCEYIEQLMLAEANAGGSNLQQSMSEFPSLLDLRSEPQKNHVDDHASQHLLSLLQRGTHLSDSTSFVNENAISSENVDSSNLKPSYREDDIRDAVNETSGVVQGTNSSLTLEALFGSAFMKELQSVEAPVSEQRSSAGRNFKTIFQHCQESELPQTANSEEFDLPQATITGGCSSLIENEGSLPGYNILEAQSSQSQIFWTGSETSETKRSKSSFMKSTANIRLPEEENLITLGDSMNPIYPGVFPLQSQVKHEELLPSSLQNNIVDRLAALNPSLVNEKTRFSPGLDGPQSVRGSCDQSIMDDSYQQLYGRPSSLPQHQMTPFQQWDPHAPINPQMNIMGPDNLLHDRHYPYPTGMTQHDSLNNPGGSRLRSASHFQMVHQMPIPENFPPQQVLDHQRGPPHPFAHSPRYIHEMNRNNPMHGFHLNHQQPGFGGPEVGMAGIGIRSGVNHPDALGRLIEMELRAKSKQNHLVAGGHVSGIYPDVDVGFRYR